MSALREGRLLSIVVLLAGTLVFAACGSADDDGGGGGGGSTQTAAADGAQLVFAVPALPTSLDISEFQGDGSRRAGYELGSTLVAYDTSGLEGAGCQQLGTVEDLRGDLAESWELSPDRRTITFRLRRGVLSNYGNELTAKDVKWSLDKSRELSGVTQFLWYTFAKYERDPVRIVDDYTVTLDVSEPTSLDLVILTSFLVRIQDSTVGREHATRDDPWAIRWFAENTADFGPWQVRPDGFDPGNEITYTPNPNYRGDRGNVDRLILRAVPDGSTRLQLLQAGEVDVINRVSYSDARALEDSEGVRVSECVSQGRDVLILQLRDERFAKPQVREAISLAIDRQTLVDNVYSGFGRPAVSGLSQAFDYPRSDRQLELDLERARELMAEAGHPDGFDATITVSPARPGPYSEQLAVLLRDQLAQIGIRLQVRQIAGDSDYAEVFQRGNYDMLLWSMASVVADPAFELNLHNTTGGFQNSHNYSNRRYDELTAQISGMAPGPERDALLTEIDELILSDLPIQLLVDTPYLLAFRENISGYQAAPHEELFAVNLVKE